jgi:uncharacterized cupin superfamily protein
MKKDPHFLIRAAQIQQEKQRFSHPLNPGSLMVGTHLSSMVGLKRSGVSLLSVPPGNESTIYHSHHCEEEWIYILQGTGTARVDDREYQVNAGDFLGFTTPSLAHNLHNSGDADLVYLVGGEHRDVEIAEFPDLGKRVIRHGETIEMVDIDTVEDLRFEGNSD